MTQEVERPASRSHQGEGGTGPEDTDEWLTSPEHTEANLHRRRAPEGKEEADETDVKKEQDRSENFKKKHFCCFQLEA